MSNSVTSKKLISVYSSPIFAQRNLKVKAPFHQVFYKLVISEAIPKFSDLHCHPAHCHLTTKPGHRVLALNLVTRLLIEDFPLSILFP
jgi:hypothetical protein